MNQSPEATHKPAHTLEEIAKMIEAALHCLHEGHNSVAAALLANAIKAARQH